MFTQHTQESQQLFGGGERGNTASKHSNIALPNAKREPPSTTHHQRKRPKNKETFLKKGNQQIISKVRLD
jgi:hypothetical protein